MEAIVIAVIVVGLLLEWFVFLPRREKRIADSIVKRLHEEGWLKRPGDKS